jgi:hypothetical protein
MCGAIPQFPAMSSCHCAYLSTGYVFMAWYLVQHRDKFYLPVSFKDGSSFNNYSYAQLFFLNH